MTTTPEHDPELVRKIRDFILAGLDSSRENWKARAACVIDVIREHESETDRAWWWREVADGETIPAGCPVRMEPKEGVMGSIGEWRAGTATDRSTRYTWFVDSRWTPPERRSKPERVSVDKAALDALLKMHDDRPGSPAQRVLYSVQPLDGGA